MNGYNFTDRVRKVLQMAREEAARLHHEYVGTEHILLGLIREGEGVAAAVLTNLNVDLEEIQQRIEETVKRLGLLFSQTATIHGVLVEVLGVGVLLLGRSGIGKSECALDLIVRGHRFVADDVIHLERRGPETLLGRGSDLTRHHMEVRGLGIINIRDLFGPPSITDLKKIELAIHIEEWDAGKEYDRLGLEDRRTVFLDVAIPSLLIPVSPARNLATIVEVAVRNHLLKGQGVFSAQELVARQRSRSGEAPPG